MDLNPIRTSILQDLYNMFYCDIYKTDIDRYALVETTEIGKIQEVIYHLLKLEKSGLIEFERKPYQEGIIFSKVYENNGIVIWWEEIKITYKGIKYMRHIGIKE